MRKGKGKEAKLAFMANALMDNRHGLVSDFRLTEAKDMAERDAALEILMRVPDSRRLSVGVDRSYHTKGLRRRVQGAKRHPACCPDEEVVCDRRMNHVPSGIQVESEGPKTCGVYLRVEEGHRRGSVRFAMWDWNGPDCAGSWRRRRTTW